jgi:hypothetical protein
VLLQLHQHTIFQREQLLQAGHLRTRLRGRLRSTRRLSRSCGWRLGASGRRTRRRLYRPGPLMRVADRRRGRLRTRSRCSRPVTAHRRAT